MSPTDWPIADKVGRHAMHSVAVLPGDGSPMQRACSSRAGQRAQESHTALSSIVVVVPRGYVIEMRRRRDKIGWLR